MRIELLDLLLTYFLVSNWLFFFKSKYLEAVSFAVKALDTGHRTQRISDHSNFYLNHFVMNLILFLFTFFFFRLEETQSPFSALKVSEFTGYNIYFWTALNIFFFWTMKQINFSRVSIFKIEYMFTVLNIFFFFTLLMICTNLYSFLLVLEICSYLFFYKLMLIPEFALVRGYNKKQLNNYYILLFYHYWASTFSTFLYFFCFNLLVHKYGSVEFGLLCFLNTELRTTSDEFLFISFVLMFILCFCLKLGFSPFHFFKLQIYEGVGYSYLLFYTTYYFIGFFFVISLLYFRLILPCAHILPNTLLWGIFFCFVLFSSSLSTNNSLRQFFLLSAVINLLNLFLILLLLIF